MQCWCLTESKLKDIKLIYHQKTYPYKKRKRKDLKNSLQIKKNNLLFTPDTIGTIQTLQTDKRKNLLGRETSITIKEGYHLHSCLVYTVLLP